MSNANLQPSLALRMEAGSINCILLYASWYAANRNLLTIADSLPAHYVEYLLLMRLMLLIHLIRRTPRPMTENYDDAGNMVQRDAEVFTYDSENKLTQVDKTVGDTVNYLYEHTGNRIRKSRTSTNEVVYNINGVYEVTKIPNLSDRHTLYIRGIKEELVAQYTASDVVLLTDSNPTNENKANVALLISSLKNTLDQTRIRFAKWVTRAQANNPFAIKLYMIYAILFCLLLYAVSIINWRNIVTSMVRPIRQAQGSPAHHDNIVILSLSKDTNNTDTSTGLRVVSLLLIVSVSFVFSNCSPKALTGGNRPAPPPYWLFAAFSSEPESPSVSTDNGNNPASGSSGGNTQVTPSSGNGNTSTSPPSGENTSTGSTSFGSGGGSLSAGTPRLGMFFFHPDHTGSISMVTDGAGRMMTDTSGASQLTYKPYGEVNRMNSYGPDIFRYKYTSQQDDQDTGLYYYNARYYDPVLGSFTSADYVTNATSSFGLNHYMYTEGNPVRYGDASGNVWGALLYAGFQFVVGSAAAIAIGSAAIGAGAALAAAGAAIAVGMAAANTAAVVAATVQTLTIATATYMATLATTAIQWAMMVNPFGTVGAGIGFMAGGLDTGTLQGALAGAEIGFKIGTIIQISVYIVAGGIELLAVTGTWAPLAKGLGGAMIGGTTGYFAGGLSGVFETGVWNDRAARAGAYLGANIGGALGFVWGLSNVGGLGKWIEMLAKDSIIKSVPLFPELIQYGYKAYLYSAPMRMVLSADSLHPISIVDSLWNFSDTMGEITGSDGSMCPICFSIPIYPAYKYGGQVVKRYNSML